MALKTYNKSTAVQDEVLMQPSVSELDGQNDDVNMLFGVARDKAFLTTDHQGIES